MKAYTFGSRGIPIPSAVRCVTNLHVFFFVRMDDFFENLALKCHVFFHKHFLWKYTVFHLKKKKNWTKKWLKNTSDAGLRIWKDEHDWVGSQHQFPEKNWCYWPPMETIGNDSSDNTTVDDLGKGKLPRRTTKILIDGCARFP